MLTVQTLAHRIALGIIVAIIVAIGIFVLTRNKWLSKFSALGVLVAIVLWQ